MIRFVIRLYDYMAAHKRLCVLSFVAVTFVFLVSLVRLDYKGKDDPTVDYHNSVLLDSALSANHVPHLYLQYETGGHGFGASSTKGTAESRAWKKEFLNWMNSLLKSKSIAR